MIRAIVILAVLTSSGMAAHAQPDESTIPMHRASNERSPTVEYASAAGRLLGSVTKIGGIMYFAGPDGRPLGKAETIDGRRVYKSY